MTEILTRAAEFSASTYNLERHTVDAVFSTGAEVARYDFEGPYRERLSMSPESVNLTDFVNGPLLDSHDRWSVRSILGIVESASVGDGRGVARLRFGKRASDDGIEADVASGILRSVSVGYRVQEYKTEKASDGSRVKTAVRWSPVELSLVSLPADKGAKIRSGGNMEETLESQIRATGGLLGITGNFIDGLIARDGMTLENARGELLKHVREAAPRIDSRTTIEVTRDETDGFIERAANAIAHRVCPAIKLRDDARPLYGRRLSDIAREMLRQRGLNSLGSDGEIIDRAIGLHTTSDYSNFLAELFNKQLLEQYALAPSGLKLLSRRGTVNDFRQKHIFRDSPMGKLQKVNENGEFKRVDKPDVKPESYSIATYAAVFGISRQALVNDDLSVFSDIASELSMQSVEFENAQLCALLISNPVMADGNALFSAAHGNLAGTGGAIGDTTLTAARLAMRTTVNQNGQPIAVNPKYLLCAATQETVAEKGLAAIYPATTANANVFTGALALVIDPRLDAAAQTLPWYIFGDPALVPVLEYSYLSGNEGPHVETRTGFAQGSDIDGTEVLCRLDFGCGAISTVGGFKNPGA